MPESDTLAERRKAAAQASAGAPPLTSIPAATADGIPEWRDRRARPRVLIVDDVATNAAVMAGALGIDYEVQFATGGRQALAALARSVPDLVLLDVHMPDVGGIEVLWHIRTMGISPPVPVILVTADACLETQVAGLELGAEDYVTRPVQPATLQLRARNALRRHRLLAEQRRLADSLDAANREIGHLLRFADLLLTAAGEGLYGVDLEGRCTFVNPAALAMTGYERDEVIGADPYALLHPRHPDASAACPARATLRDGARRDVDDVFTRKDGASLPVHLTVTPMVQNGLRVGAEVIVHSTAERRRLEEARLRSRKLEALGTLAAGLARDFNNILAAIRGNAELAAEDLDAGHPSQEGLAEIRKAAARATELVRRITGFGRPRDWKREVVELPAVVDESLRGLRSALPAQVAIRTRFQAGAPRIQADPAVVQEAVVNLTTNAVHAIGPRAGAIDYVLQATDVAGREADGLGIAAGRYARLTVKDTGCGMDDSTLARVFDAFFTTKPFGQGSGLGLSLVYGIMRAHGGTVAVESEPGRGSSFHLYFPAADTATEVPVPALRADGASPSRRVLYVDDEEALVSVARRALPRLGHRVTAFADPVRALDAFRSRPADFDVVVTDLAMPRLSGLELARQVRGVRPEMPIVMTTDFFRSEDEAAAAREGVHKLVPKSATIAELALVIEGLFA